MSARSVPQPNAGVFATALRRQREASGLTQAELAGRAGVGVRTVSNLERGINTVPYPSTVRLLADALGLADGARTDLLVAAGRRKGGRTGTPQTGGYLGALPPAGLVAREAECAAIVHALTKCAAGEGQAVLLAGEPGIGKTRLAQEASTYAADRGFAVVSGRCYEQQAETPFVPVLEVFGMLYEAAPALVRESVLTRWPSLATLLPDHFPRDAAQGLTGPDAAQVLYREATNFVRDVAQHQPVAILADDLHWADDASLELLSHLARNTTRDPVLLLGTFRDGEVGIEHPIRRLAQSLLRERFTRTIGLGRFDRDTTARLIAQHLDGSQVAEDLSDLVHRHSGGNPFFTVEIVTALIERGDLARVDGSWVCRELDEIGTPVSISEMIGARFGRLSPAAREALEAASVLGAVFDPDDVPELGANEEVLEAAFDEAVASGLLTVDEDRYAFDHSLTQQALYARLSPVRRRRLHRSAGERLETRPHAARRRRSAEIARHLELGGLPDRALPFSLLAGDVATAAYAHTEATRLYGHARELADEVGDEAAGAAALEGLGQVQLMTARYDAAVEDLVKAAERYRRVDDLESRLRVEGMIANGQHSRGEGEAAAERLDEVVAELEVGTGSDRWAVGGAVLANGLARVRLSLGQHELCVEATERAARFAQQEGSPAAEADAYAVGGTALLFLDRPDDAVRVLEKGVALGAAIDAPASESLAMMGLQWATTMRGELDRGRAFGERGLELTRRAGNTDMESHHAAGLGLTLFYSGDWDKAERHLEHSLELARAGSPTLFSGIPPVYLGVLRAGQGDAAAATACYDEAATAPDLQTFAFAGYLQARRAELELRDGEAARALARLEPWLGEEAPTRVHDVMLLIAAAEACLALDDIDRGEALVAQALRRATATRNQIDGVDARRLKGRCHLLRGQNAEGRLWLEEATALAVTVGYPAAEQRARADIAILLGFRG